MRYFLTMIMIFSALGAPVAVSAEGERLILTWAADSYYPAFYAGKAPATRGSRVRVAAEMVVGSKIVGLKEADFIWSVDGDVILRGKGQKEAEFEVRAAPGGRHFVQVTIKAGEAAIQSAVAIPVAAPELVVEFPSLDNFVSAGREVILRAVPYFFSAGSFKDFEFFWQVNGGENQAAGGDNELKIRAPYQAEYGGGEITVAAGVINKVNPLQTGREVVRLRIRN